MRPIAMHVLTLRGPSVTLGVGHDCESCQNDEDTDAGCKTDCLRGLKEPCMKRGCTLAPPGEYARSISVRALATVTAATC